MGMNDEIRIGNDHYHIGWDTSYPGMIALVLWTNMPVRNKNFLNQTIVRMYINEDDLNKLIEALQQWRDKYCFVHSVDKATCEEEDNEETD